MQKYAAIIKLKPQTKPLGLTLNPAADWAGAGAGETGPMGSETGLKALWALWLGDNTTTLSFWPFSQLSSCPLMK